MGDYQPCYKCVVTYPPLHPSGVSGVSEGKGEVYAPVILRLCIVQYVSWCLYFMHCELNHAGAVTSDATTCFSVKCGCACLQHHAPPLLPLPSHSSHPPGVGVVSGGVGVVGVPSASAVAAYHARDTTATPAEGCVLLY